MNEQKTSMIIKVENESTIINQLKEFAKKNKDKGLGNTVLQFDLPYEFFVFDEIMRVAKKFGTSPACIGIADDFCRVPIGFTIGNGRAIWQT